MDKLQEQEDQLAKLGVQRGTATFCDFLKQLTTNQPNQTDHERD